MCVLCSRELCMWCVCVCVLVPPRVLTFRRGQRAITLFNRRMLQQRMSSPQFFPTLDADSLRQGSALEGLAGEHMSHSQGM
eukprot:11376153-Prorocentrum_lima.AAC.1